MTVKSTKRKANSNLAKKTKGGDLAVFDYGDDAGSGFQNQTQDDIQVPILGIIQDLSPQTKKKQPEFIEGAEVGMLFNPVTGEIVDGEKGWLFVPSITDHCFMEWVPRLSGGGLVARHELDSPVVGAARSSGAKINEFKVNDNDLVETYYIVGLLVTDDGEPIMPVILAMTKSKIRVYRKWNSAVRMHQINVGGRRMNPPLFANLVRITTFEDENNNGDCFQNFVLSPANGTLASSLLAPDDIRLMEAKAIGESYMAGTAKADYATADATSAAGGETVPF